MTTIARYTKKVRSLPAQQSRRLGLEYAILIGVIAVAMSAALATFSD